MAKPKTEGFPYCQEDTDTFFDAKIRMLIARYGCDGYALWDYIKQSAYREHGYFVEWNEDRADLASADLMITVEKIGLILDYILKRSLFVKIQTFQRVTILTSRGIQKRFQRMAKDTKRIYPYRQEIWLLNEEETFDEIFYDEKNDNSGINIDNSRIKDDNSSFIQQSKVKNSKVKNSICTHIEQCNEGMKNFFNEHPEIQVDITSTAMLGDIDYSLLEQKISESRFLKEQKSLSFFIRNWKKIKADSYKDFEYSNKPKKESQIDIRNKLYKELDENGGDFKYDNNEKKCN